MNLHGVRCIAASILFALSGIAMAQVEVNKGDRAALDGIKGIGPSMSAKILTERQKNGPYKDWGDFEHRVVGVGEKSARKLSDAGLQVNGKPKAK